MCRFLVYKGRHEIRLSKLVTEPSHSILTQSYDSRLRLDNRRPVNGDGFGVGFYTDPKLGPEPCIFTSTLPAWNCENLERLASKTCSNLIFAHVRATTEGTLSDTNCHPFQHQTLMWMHNGNVGGWHYIKRTLADSLADKWYLGVKGGTDSEWAFALFLDLLEKEGVDPSSNPGPEGFGQALLRKVMVKTIAKINEFIRDIPKKYNVSGVETRSLLNFAVTDGHTVVCTRYISSKTDEPASLYFSSGTKWKEGKDKGHFKMERHDKGADIVLVASEPITFERHNWVSVPANSIVTIHKQSVLLHPILDEFYTEDINQDRSSCYAVSKGLVSTAPMTTVQPQDAEVLKDATVSGKSTRLDDLDVRLSNQCALSH
ncbi:probable glutamine amidotransferase DUG3 [Aspergillus udagawae]|uniref:Probable glutamine amidotransferase DUG3 n=1 Tax=Aspergillus udagawae TaxID=91492 RepID=A0ABQ1BDU4_9EURO|nr:probable glutamine amidotransferase DUG3 [Aspergillus udagawae]GFF60936.1 probable glutamine amidotransferase DUG3 [Aspergillus udagawae]GFF99448.1 probable glutamine amidotransferase DUG3 [Aspergillus udagawae]GFG18950.1 probable glutamine amidotransferase DUG3 [Aspergillus udagawae]